MDELWKSRNDAHEFLQERALSVVRAFEDCFVLVDECAIQLLAADSHFSLVTSLIVVKGRNLTHGLFSLCLDSLAQEGGALFRPLLEVVELLEYLIQDPYRVESIVDSKPKAGEIARSIGSEFKRIRDHLNQEASHASLGVHALRHCVSRNSAESPELQLQQVFMPAVLLVNLTTLFSVMCFLAEEAVSCLAIATGQDQSVLSNRAGDIFNAGMAALDEAQSEVGL